MPVHTDSSSGLNNILLLAFLVYFIIGKVRFNYDNLSIYLKNTKGSLINVIIKTLGFTYLNPHVYSDTVFFLGNFSKNFLITQKYYFGIGAAIASFLFFFSLGFLSKFLSKYLQNQMVKKLHSLLRQELPERMNLERRLIITQRQIIFIRPSTPMQILR